MDHNHQLQEIHNQVITSEHFGPCVIEKCVMFKRHYSKNRRNNGHGAVSQTYKHQQDPLFLFYRELFDSAHHYIYHLYDVGLREKVQKITAKLRTNLKGNGNM